MSKSPFQSDAVTIERHPVNYSPGSSTTINRDRLPPLKQLRSMELAYRQQPLDTKDLNAAIERAINLFLVILPASVLALLFAAPLGLRLYALIGSVEGGRLVAGILGGMALLAFGIFVAFIASTTLQLAFIALAGIPIVAALGAALFPHYRLIITGTVSVIALVLLLIPQTTSLLVRFFREWMLADHRIDSKTRRDWLSTLTPGKRTRPNVIAAILFCSAPALAARYSPALGAAVALGLCAVFTGFVRGHKGLFYAARRVLTPYLTYNGIDASAPGVWVPPTSINARLFALFLPCSAFCTALALGLLPDSYPEALTTSLPYVAVLIPVTALAILALYRDPIRTADELRQRIEAHLKAQPQRTWWECQVERLRASRHKATDSFGAQVSEAQHLFLGSEPVLNFPILLDQKILSEHCYMLGRTGSGKTTLGIMSLLLQIVRDDAPPTPIIVLDLKGDPPLFHTLRAEAEAKKQKFLFFTLEPGCESHLFNPFKGFDSKNRSLPQLVQLILDSLSLNHGEGYGRSYYSQRSRYLLSQALQDPAKPRSFGELYKTVQKLAASNKQIYQDTFELLATIETLTHYPQLVTTRDQEIKNPDQVIHMQTALEEGQIIYFWLPSALESISVREVGKLAIFNLLTAAIDRQRANKTRQTYLVIDEFQKLAGENLKGVLEQARSFGIGATLSNQSLADLKTPDFDLRPTIRTNTRAKFYFSITEPDEIKNLSSISGEELQILSEDEHESLKPRLTVQDIAAIGDHPTQFLLHVTAGSGYTQFAGLPVPVQAQWPIPYDLYEKRRKDTPWPAKTQLPPNATVQSKKAPAHIDNKVKAALATQTAQADQFIQGLFDD